MTSGIYCIENVINGKRYIGKSINIEDRMWDNHKDCTIIEYVIKKHKQDNLIRYVIEYCDSEEISFWEQYYIREWKTKVPNGYNLTDGGDGGINPSEETRKKMRESHPDQRGENNNNYGNRGEKNPIYGRHFSDEHKTKIGKANSGIKNYKFGTKSSNASSQYFGVLKINDHKKYIYWLAYMKKDGKLIRIAFCKAEIEAAYAYNRYVIEHNLPNPLNILEEYLEDRREINGDN